MGNTLSFSWWSLSLWAALKQGAVDATLLARLTVLVAKQLAIRSLTRYNNKEHYVLLNWILICIPRATV